MAITMILRDFRVIVFEMIFLTIESLKSLKVVKAEYCPGYGAPCPPQQRCCLGGSMCCIPSNIVTDIRRYDTEVQFGVWNLWYFWFAVVFLFMACTGVCAFWRYRRRLRMAEEMAWTAMSFNELVVPRRYYRSSGAFSNSSTLDRMSYFTSILSSSVVLSEPQGEFPSPPPYSEISNKQPRSECWKELPPYPGHSVTSPGLCSGFAAPKDPTSDRDNRSESVESSRLQTSPPSYSSLPDAEIPPGYRSDTASATASTVSISTESGRPTDDRVSRE